VALTLAFASAAQADHDAYAPPPNDSGSSASPVNLNATVENGSVLGASTQPGERLDCKGHGYGHTVWYAFTVAVRGQVVVTTLGTSYWDSAPLDTVLSVQRTGYINDPALDCQDDGAGQDFGGSRVELTLDPGDYIIQVGTYDYTFLDPMYRPQVIGPDTGTFSVDVRFAQDLDLDDDGFPANNDCVDTNAAIHPNAPDIEFNGIDEDCRNGDDRDHDNDGYPREGDCNDGKARVNRDAREIPGDFEDENCDGKRPGALLDPFPTVVFPTSAYSNRTITSKLEIKDVRRGYLIRVKCSGHGCPKKSVKRKLKSADTVQIKPYFGATLRPGAVVRVFVTRPGTNSFGKYAKFTIRRSTAPKRTDCRLVPRKKKPTNCKTS
jgi:hypothetical protein